MQCPGVERLFQPDKAQFLHHPPHLNGFAQIIRTNGIVDQRIIRTNALADLAKDGNIRFAAFVGVKFVQEKLPERIHYKITLLADIPLLGPAFFTHHPLVYFAVALAVLLIWFFYYTRAGLVLRSVGESPESAHALGYSVRSIRLAAVLVGGALCGLAGAYLSLVTAPLWVEGMTAGRGWIALALTTFASWRPLRVLVGAYLFGGVTMLQFYLQGQGVQISSHLLSALPYMATIAVLVLISTHKDWVRLNMPASLGKPFFPRE